VRKSLSVAALAVLVVALLLATGLNADSGTNTLSAVNPKSIYQSAQSSLSSSLIENYSRSRQFQAGTIFDNQSYSIAVDPLSQDFAIGDLNRDGLSDVAVISSKTNDICIYNRTANGAFSSIPWRISKPGIADMRSIAIGDLYNNGLNDIVVSYYNQSKGYIAIFEQSSKPPYFENVTVLGVDPEPYQVVIGRFDGTTNESIATVCGGSPLYSDIDIWKYPFTSQSNDYQSIQTYDYTKHESLTNAKFLAAGDINGDGRTDLVAGGANGSSVFIAFQPPSWGIWNTSFITFDGGSASASDVQLADLVNGKSDLIFANDNNEGGYSTVNIYLNNGNGFSTTPWNITRTPLGLNTVAVGNLSSGSGETLLVLSYGYANMSVYNQNSNGYFRQSPNLSFSVDVSPLKAVVDDSIVDHEGVFILCQGPVGSNGTLCWYDSNPNLTGNANVNLFTGTDSPTNLTVGRLANGNEIVAATLSKANKVLLYEYNSSLSWTILTQSRPIAAVFGNFSTPNDEDLAVLNSDSNISLYHVSQFPNANQPFENITLPFSNPQALTAESLRDNGYDDLLVGYGKGCFILYNTKNGQPFKSAVNETIGGSITGNRTAICVGDFNSEYNSNDIALLNTATNEVEIYPRNATGSLGHYYSKAPNAYLSPTSHFDLMQLITMGDFGNSRADVAAITTDGKLLIFLQPNYGFTYNYTFSPYNVELGSKPSSLASGDVNDDGLTDLIVGFANSPRLAAYLQTGSGSFQNSFNLTTGAAPAAVSAQDINGDGRTDIVCASPGSHSISIWFQNDLAPVAIINGSSWQYKGVDAIFSGAGSQDSYSDMSSLNYTWTLGDGSTSYGMTISHIYDNIATYTVVLNVTDRSGLYNTNISRITILQTYPSVNLTIWPLSPTEGSWLSFNDTSQSSNVSKSPIQAWQWEFDGTISNTTKNAMQRFGAGEHTVKLTIKDADGISNSTRLRFFNVTEVPPSARFQVSSAKVGTAVYFNSTSSYAWTPIVGYRWDFGDGNTTNGTDPTVSHTFDMKGWYKIILNVTDGKGYSDETIRWIYVNATPPTASLNLIGSSVEGSVTKFNLITFTFNTIISWNWSYDNNQTWHIYHDAVTGSSYVFSNNGSYWVSLNVTEKDGAWSLTSVLVNVQDTTPEILGLWAPEGLSYKMDQSVSFWASAILTYKPITKYEWNFDYGGGGTWIASNPFLTNHTSWTFTKPGIYYVKLRVWDDDGYAQYSSYLEIQVNDVAPVAHFSYHNSTQTSGKVLFDATLSTDTPSDISSLAFSWNFGDQSGWTAFSTANKTISHEFALDGRYNVTLIVRDQWGNESALVYANILVDRTPPSVVMESTGSNASAGQAIIVSVKVTDQFGVKQVLLEYRLNNGSWAAIPMTPMNEPDIFYGQIPAQASNTSVSYMIIATDANNNSYSTQTYLLNIKAASSLGISLEYLGLLTILIIIILAILIYLIYRTLVPVDEVFIIFQDGQLMAHQTRRIKPGMDDDILASMFVAIQMFVKDSFKDESSTGLNRMDFGKKKILVEKGESFYLAVVLHSNRTGSVPKRMQMVIDDIQTNYGPVLKGWDGDLEKVRGVKDTVNSLVKHKGPFGKR
jgi:hypothetical protein